eukprot:4962692-Pleurochrysis_carterae.AAC.1
MGVRLVQPRDMRRPLSGAGVASKCLAVEIVDDGIYTFWPMVWQLRKRRKNGSGCGTPRRKKARRAATARTRIERGLRCAEIWRGRDESQTRGGMRGDERERERLVCASEREMEGLRKSGIVDGSNRWSEGGIKKTTRIKD